LEKLFENFLNIIGTFSKILGTFSKLKIFIMH
jgi:hypothetical protein